MRPRFWPRREDHIWDGAIGTVECVGVGLGPVVPEIHDAVYATVECDGDLLVAFIRGGRLEVSDALLQIGATIAAKVGGFGKIPGQATRTDQGCG